MSQSGLLNEEEIKDFINENFNLKLTREAFMNPSKELVTEIYIKFIDDTGLKWKRRADDDDFDDPTPSRSRLAGRVQFLIAKYNCQFKCGLMDLLEPQRKRTVAFLNVLIFIKAQIDEQRRVWQEAKEEWLVNNREAEEKKRQLAQLKLKIEELALEKSNKNMTKEQLRQKIEEERVRFEQLQQQGQAAAEEAKNIKIKLQEVLERHNKKKLEYEERLGSVKQYEATLQSLNDGRIIKSKVHDLQNTLEVESSKMSNLAKENQALRAKTSEMDRLAMSLRSDDEETSAQARVELRRLGHSLELVNPVLMKLETEEKELKRQIYNLEQSCKQTRLRNELEVERARREAEERRKTNCEETNSFRAEVNELKNVVQALSNRIEENRSKHAAMLETRQKEDDKKVRKFEVLKTRVLQCSKSLQPKIVESAHNRTKLETLFHGPREIEQISIHKDRTYIKEQ